MIVDGEIEFLNIDSHEVESIKLVERQAGFEKKKKTRSSLPVYCKYTYNDGTDINKNN